MIASFKDKELQRLWQGKPSKIDARLHRRILRRLDALHNASSPDELNIAGFDFHGLQGFNPQRYTIHVNGPLCITFAFENGDAIDVKLENYHKVMP